MGDITVFENAFHGSLTLSTHISYIHIYALTRAYLQMHQMLVPIVLLTRVHTHSGIEQYTEVCSKWLKRLHGCASINDVGCCSHSMAKRCCGRMSMKHKIWATSEAYEYFPQL